MGTFEEINQKIQNYIKDHKAKWYSLGDRDEHKLPLTDSIFCAEDSVRNSVFWKAIAEYMSQNSQESQIVVDAGSGIGILGLFALLLGARKCYFIEENPFTMEFAKKFIEDFGMKDKAIFLREDARQSVIPEPFHLLISETLTSGFVEEDFLSIILNLKKYASPTVQIIPEKFQIKIDEIGGNQKILATQNILIESKNLKEKKLLMLRHPKTQKIRFQTDACLYDNTRIMGNSCMAVLNDRIFDIEEGHQFFEIIKFDHNKKL